MADGLIGRTGILAVFLFATFLPAQGQAASSGPASAPEAGLRRFELGGQVTDMRVGSCFGEGIPCLTPQFGLGVGASLNLNQHFAIDSSYSILPRQDPIRQGASFFKSTRRVGTPRSSWLAPEQR